MQQEEKREQQGLQDSLPKEERLEKPLEPLVVELEREARDDSHSIPTLLDHDDDDEVFNAITICIVFAFIIAASCSTDSIFPFKAFQRHNSHKTHFRCDFFKLLYFNENYSELQYLTLLRFTPNSYSPSATFNLRWILFLLPKTVVIVFLSPASLILRFAFLSPSLLLCFNNLCFFPLQCNLYPC